MPYQRQVFQCDQWEKKENNNTYSHNDDKYDDDKQWEKHGLDLGFLCWNAERKTSFWSDHPVGS